MKTHQLRQIIREEIRNIAKSITKHNLNEILYYVGYNKGRGLGKGIFKDSYSSYEDAKKAVEKIEKDRGGSSMTAYYVADKDGRLVAEPVNEEKSFADLEFAIGHHKKDNPYYDLTKLKNIFNQLKNNDQIKARKKYSEYFGK